MMLTTCFGHCGPSSGHKIYKEGTIQCMFIGKVQILNFQRVESLEFALYQRTYMYSSLFIYFVTWRWPTVAETRRQHHNKQDARQLCFDVPTPFPISHIILPLSANHQFPTQGFCLQFFISLLATATIQQSVRPSVGHALWQTLVIKTVVTCNRARIRSLLK